MLKKKDITNIEIYTDDWHTYRVGRITSSMVFSILGDDIGKGATTYLYQKAGEIITGKSNEREIDFNEDMDWGKMYEQEALKLFGKKIGVPFLVTQTLISDRETMFSSTPDALIISGESLTNNDEYNVSTVECKCPRTYSNFIGLSLCKTPKDLYKFSKKYYWQVIDQMHQCDSTIGYFFCYHPLFPEGSNIHIIEFRKLHLWDDFKKLSSRKNEAVKIVNKIISDLKKM